MKMNEQGAKCFWATWERGLAAHATWPTRATACTHSANAARASNSAGPSDTARVPVIAAPAKQSPHRSYNGQCSE